MPAVRLEKKSKVMRCRPGNRRQLHLHLKQDLLKSSYLLSFAFPFEFLQPVCWDWSRPRERVRFLKDNGDQLEHYNKQKENKKRVSKRRAYGFIENTNNINIVTFRH